MAATTVEQEMIALETAFWQAMQDNDVDAAMAATDDPCVVAGASGAATVDAAMFRSMMSGGAWKLNSFRLGDDDQVRALSEDVRVVAYTVHEELTVDGQPVSLDAADTSVWVRRGGRWLCAMHSESLLGDAYGRDRR